MLAEIWDGVKAATLSACESFNEHYAKSEGDRVKWAAENNHRLVIKRSIPVTASTQSRYLEVCLEYSFSSHKITATKSQGGQAYLIDADESGTFLQAESRMSPDAISQRILEFMLFPASPAMRPGQPSPGNEFSWMS